MEGRGRDGEKHQWERDTWIDCLPQVPPEGEPGLRNRCVPLAGTKPGTCQSAASAPSRVKLVTASLALFDWEVSGRYRPLPASGHCGRSPVRWL